MRQWIDLFEKNIPSTFYGYWITDMGEFLPVEFEQHAKVALRNGTNYGHALQNGWIRLVESGSNVEVLNINYEIGATNSRTISALRKLMRAGRYSIYNVDIRGRVFAHRHFEKIADVIQLMNNTSHDAILGYSHEDWQWAEAGAHGEMPSKRAPSE